MKYFHIYGVLPDQAKELVDNLNSIDGVEANVYVKEGYIQYKALAITILIGFGTGVIGSIVGNYLYDWLKKTKSKDDKSITIKCDDIEIIQGDKIQVIQNKIKQIINLQ